MGCGQHGQLKVEVLVFIIFLWSTWSMKNKGGEDASRIVIVYSSGITVEVIALAVV